MWQLATPTLWPLISFTLYTRLPTCLLKTWAWCLRSPNQRLLSTSSSCLANSPSLLVPSGFSWTRSFWLNPMVCQAYCPSPASSGRSAPTPHHILLSFPPPNPSSSGTGLAAHARGTHDQKWPSTHQLSPLPINYLEGECYPPPMAPAPPGQTHLLLHALPCPSHPCHCRRLHGASFSHSKKQEQPFLDFTLLFMPPAQPPWPNNLLSPLIHNPFILNTL